MRLYLKLCSKRLPLPLIFQTPMALIHSFEKSGNWLFRYRGQLPVVLFLTSIPVIWFTSTYGMAPDVMLAITVGSLIISFAGLIVRAIAIGTTPKGTSGRNTKEQVAESLNISGIYSCMRHPLYLGNYLMWIGIVVFTCNVGFTIIVSLAFWLYYERIMFAEERFLEAKFGKKYMDWSQSVPAFIPSFSDYKPGSVPFSFITVLRREYSGVFATTFGFAFIDNLRFWFQEGTFQFGRVANYSLVAAFLLMLILRTLKHNTSLLSEKDRS
jgi:protein-S-isoprenylcysteine O-methyltransferase Ste14